MAKWDWTRPFVAYKNSAGKIRLAIVVRLGSNDVHDLFVFQKPVEGGAAYVANVARAVNPYGGSFANGTWALLPNPVAGATDTPFPGIGDLSV